MKRHRRERVIAHLQCFPAPCLHLVCIESTLCEVRFRCIKEKGVKTARNLVQRHKINVPIKEIYIREILFLKDYINRRVVVGWSQRIRSFIGSGKHNKKRETRKFVFPLFRTTLKTSNFCFSLQGKQYSRCIIDTRQDWVMGVSWQGGKSCGKESFSVVSEKNTARD